jgi:hypothetical protein
MHSGVIRKLNVTVRTRSQLVATLGNGLRLSERFSRTLHLPPVATGCDR